MPREKRVYGPDDFMVVRMIYGKGPDAKNRYGYLPSGGMNDVIAEWQSKQEDRPMTECSPSKVSTCPRVIWLRNREVPVLNQITWAVRQRMLLGRIFENKFAEQIRNTDAGVKLLHHWEDYDYSVDEDEKPFKFTMGEESGDFMTGVPDYLIEVKTKDGPAVAISDAKTSRSDSFGYVGTNMPEVWDDGGWYKYKMQLTAYWMLCQENKDWFRENGLPVPTHCHLFSYALDDGVVRREFLWQPTAEDVADVQRYMAQFNDALQSEEMPECTCNERDGFQRKFCPYGILAEGQKVAEQCCDESLIDNIKEKTNATN